MRIFQSKIIVLNISIHTCSGIELHELEINVRKECLVRVSVTTRK
jgi:hypothetical protein